MPSPLEQNERHIAVLKDVFDQIEMPTRLGLRLAPTFHTLVLIAPDARIDRPKKFDTSRVIKADQLSKTLKKDLDDSGVLGAFSLAKVVASETIEDIGRQLLLRHAPIKIDYTAKFGLNTVQKTVAATTVVSPPIKLQPKQEVQDKKSMKCRACGSEKLTVQYGKYGYFFKCASCDGNTPIKLGCGVDGHKERLRKEGNKFYRECTDCKTSSLFFQNPAEKIA